MVWMTGGRQIESGWAEEICSIHRKKQTLTRYSAAENPTGKMPRIQLIDKAVAGPLVRCRQERYG